MRTRSFSSARRELITDCRHGFIGLEACKVPHIDLGLEHLEACLCCLFKLSYRLTFLWHNDKLLGRLEVLRLGGLEQ